MKHPRIHTRVIIALLLLILLAAPTLAQDSTTEATPIASEVTPLASKEAVAPVAVEMEAGSGDLTINNTTSPSTTPTETEPDTILSLTLGELIGILFGAGALLVGIGKILWDANQNPGGPSVDTRLTQRIDQAHADREWMAKVERAYELGSLQTKSLVDALAGVLSNVAPLTPIQVDDAVLKLLKDIQERGSSANVTPGPDLPTRSATSVYPDAG